MPRTFDPRVFELPSELDLPRALHRLRRRPGLCALDSAAGEPRRWGVLAFDPLRALSLRAPEGPLGRDPRTALRAALADLEAPEVEVPGPFAGGFMGALSYDLGVQGERPVEAPPEPWGCPDLVGGVYGDFLVRDEQRGRSWLVLDGGADDGRAALEPRREELLEELLGADEPVTPEPAASPRPACPRRHVSSAEHMRRIDRVRAAIAEGELYQANLAHRFTARVGCDPTELYLRLRRVNPAPYMGFCTWDDAQSGPGALLSASPELLFEFDGQTARTRPIKGTAPRALEDPVVDRARAEQLLESAKDLAELVMIVDLERNDLGRISRPGGVRVEGFPTLRSYARVHHLMADVLGDVRPGVDALEVLAALFPGGSVTGAPKLSSMDLIARLEGQGRGFFCGSLGFVDTRGRSCFNILIRTLVWRPRASAGEVSFRVGGGITWASDPAAEDRETLDKAAGLLDALAQPTDPWAPPRS